MNDDAVERIKQQYPSGTRVRVLEMDDQYPVPSGIEGTVEDVDAQGTIHVTWNNGSSLGLILGVDKFEVIK